MISAKAENQPEEEEKEVKKEEVEKKEPSEEKDKVLPDSTADVKAEANVSILEFYPMLFIFFILCTIIKYQYILSLP